MPMTLTLEEFATKGFAIVPGVLEADAVAEMRELLALRINEQDARWGGFEHYLDRSMVHNLMMHGEPFKRLLSNPVLHEHLSRVFDPHCTLYAYTSSSMPAGGTNYSNRVHVDCPRFIPGYMTNVGFITALDDFTEDNGATSFLPGSHLSGETPSDAQFAAGAERVFPKAGDGIIFNARTFHLGGRNVTDRDRHAVTMNVCRPWMKQRFDYPRLMPLSDIDSLDETARRFIGWNARVPSSLEEYYVSPEQRMYKAGQG